MPDTQPLPDDKDALRALVMGLQAQSDALQEQSHAWQTQNASFEKALKVERAKVRALDQHIATLDLY